MNKGNKRYKLSVDFKDYIENSLETIIVTLGNGENIPFEYGKTREIIDMLNTTNNDFKSLKLGKYSIEKLLFTRNIMSAINFIVSQVSILSDVIKSNIININDYLIDTMINIHSKIMSMSNKNPGVLRTKQVYIKGSNYTPPHCDKILKILKSIFNELNPKNIESIFLCTVRLMKLQPFLDGNAITMQLLGSLLMLANGYKPFYTDFKNNIRSTKSLINYYEDYNFINYVENKEKFNKSVIESHELKVANGVFQQ